MGDASGAAWAAHTGPAQHTWRSLLVTHCWAGLGWAGWLDAAPTSPHQNHGLCCRGAAAVPPSPVTGHWAAGGCRRGWVCAVLCPLWPLCPLRPGLNKTEQCGEHRQQAGPTQRTWPGPPLLPGLDWLYSSTHRHQHQVTRQSEDSGQSGTLRISAHCTGDMGTSTSGPCYMSPQGRQPPPATAQTTGRTVDM